MYLSVHWVPQIAQHTSVVLHGPHVDFPICDLGFDLKRDLFSPKENNISYESKFLMAIYDDLYKSHYLIEETEKYNKLAKTSENHE